jgi:hypothetical protein
MARRCLLLVGLICLFSGCSSIPKSKCAIHPEDLAFIKDITQELHSGILSEVQYSFILNARLGIIANRPECHLKK